MQEGQRSKHLSVLVETSETCFLHPRSNSSSVLSACQGCRLPEGPRRRGGGLASLDRGIVDGHHLLHVGTLDDSALRHDPDAVTTWLLVLEVSHVLWAASERPRPCGNLPIPPLTFVAILGFAENVRAFPMLLASLPQSRVDVTVGVLESPFPLTLPVHEAAMVKATRFVIHAAYACLHVLFEGA